MRKNVIEISDEGLADSGDGVTPTTLLGRKSVLLGMAASMGIVFANAAKPATAEFPIPPDH